MALNIATIGVPSSLGGVPLGAEHGPAELWKRGIVARLRATGVDVTDFGDVPIPAHRRGARGSAGLASIETVARWVAKHSWRALGEGMVPLVVGGDHSAALGNIAAAAQVVHGLGVIWIDAHPDFNTPETSPTGNVHGMVLAIAAGWGPTPLVRLLGYAPMVHSERIVVIGARSIDAGEMSNLRRAGVRVFDSEHVERFGILATMGEAMAYLASKQTHAVHLSVDLDILDPARWPGVSTAATGGISVSDLCLMTRTVADMAPIAAMDLVELTPPEDVDGVTAEAAMQVLEHTFAPRAGIRLSDAAALR
ncbi:MAG TPA: arginase [Chloroflexota bacterium]|nr:arginase [Chloroflexota bacterium]